MAQRHTPCYRPAVSNLRRYGVAACIFAAVTAFLVVTITAEPGSHGLQPELRAFLSNEMKFSRQDLVDLEAGKIVSRGLSATAPGEVAAVGAIRVHVSRQQFVERYKDIERFKRGADVLQIGRFGHPPALENLSALSLGKQDLDLRSCRVAHCDVRLPADAIGRFQHEIDWNAQDADQRAATLFKQILFAHVQAYVSGQPGRIRSYDDEKRVVRPVEEFGGLLAASPFVGKLVPGLVEHLRMFPEDALEGAEDFLYWSKEKFGLTPFVSVTHVTIAPPGPTSTVVTSKDVYSSRYFDASLTVTIISDAVGSEDEIYLVYVNRSRASALKGSFAGLRRSIVERKAKSSLDENLKGVKLRLEGAAP
jgi:hypothetical protein